MLTDINSSFLLIYLFLIKIKTQFMKKITLLIFSIFCAMIINAQSNSDIGVIEILKPDPPFTFANNPLSVKVRVKNFSTDTILSFNVEYKYDTQLHNIPWSGSLLPGTVTDILFSNAVYVAAGSKKMFCYTILSNDNDYSNDTSIISVMGLPKLHIPYNNNFDGTLAWVAYGDSSLWQRGIPSANIIDTSHSSPNAWSTNLSGNYVDKCKEYLYTPFFYFSASDSSTMEFYYWIDAENNDGGYIEYTLTGGAIWDTLGIYNDINGVNWCPDTVNGFPGWSGTSNGWQFASLEMPAIFNLYPTPIQFRFVFYADSLSSSKNGWAIDDFKIRWPDIAQDAGVTTIVYPAVNDSTPIGSLVNIQLTIENFGTDIIVDIPVTYTVNGFNYTSETIAGANLAPDSSLNYTFATPFTSPVQQYDICVFTELLGDVYYHNDTLCNYIFVKPSPFDIKVDSVFLQNTTHPDSIAISARVINVGTDTITTFDIEYSFNGFVLSSENWSGVLASGNSLLYTFLIKQREPMLKFYLCVNTLLQADNDLFNNELCSYVSMSEDYASGFYLNQNNPNPAFDYVKIEYELFTYGKIKFTLYDLLGNIKYAKEEEVNAGIHIIEFDVSHLAAGIYFYSMEFNREQLTKKMIISK